MLDVQIPFVARVRCIGGASAANVSTEFIVQPPGVNWRIATSTPV
jgi:hypothetical protein